MGRDIAAANAVQSEAAETYPVIFVKLEFDDGTVYLHNSIGSITTLGQTWLGVGDFGGVSAIEEGEAISPYGVQLELSGLDADMLDETLNEDYFGRPVSLYIGFLTDSGGLADDPDLIWDGFIDTLETSIGSQNAIIARCESRLAMFDRANAKLQTDAQQQIVSTNDRFYQYLPRLIDQVLTWGGDGGTSWGGGYDISPEDNDPGQPDTSQL